MPSSLRGAKRQSNPSFLNGPMDCFAEPVSGRRFAPTRWLAMTRIGSRVSMRQDLRQKLLRAVTAGLAEEIRLERVFDDFPLVHENDPMRHLAGKTHFVGDDH